MTVDTLFHSTLNNVFNKSNSLILTIDQHSLATSYTTLKAMSVSNLAEIALATRAGESVV